MDQSRVALSGHDIRYLSIGGMGRIDCGVRNDRRHQSLDGLPALPGLSLHCRDIHGVGRHRFGSELGRTSANVFPAVG